MHPPLSSPTALVGSEELKPYQLQYTVMWENPDACVLFFLNILKPLPLLSFLFLFTLFHLVIIIGLPTEFPERVM
jgi:hypothetical protein